MSNTLKRIVQARLYQYQTWTVQGETPETVGKILAQFTPSYVSGLMHPSAEKPFTAEQGMAFAKIRETVLKENPNCKFDIVLNPRHYKNAEAMTDHMATIMGIVTVEGWFLDFYEAPYKADGKMIAAVVAFAHQYSQFVGGSTTTKNIAEKLDFIAVHDGKTVDLKQKEEIAELIKDLKTPVAYHLNNDNDKSDDDSIHTFMKKWDTKKRVEHIKRLARNQTSWKYRLMYPVFFPVYLNKEAYHAPKDGNMAEVIKGAMKLYNQ